MFKLFRLLRPLPVLGISAFLLLLILLPGPCATGAADGLILCGRIIIPSLFPFTAGVLFLMRSCTLSFPRVQRIIQKIFHMDAGRFLIFLLSMIGGYPVGAKLIYDRYSNGKISRRNAHLLQCCCVNAGPGFIVLAVGSGILQSKTAGYLLLLSHFLSGLFCAVILGFFTESQTYSHEMHHFGSLSERFVNAVSDAASSVFGVCGYIVLFSALLAYLEHFSQSLPFLRIFGALCEVTSGIHSSRSLPFIAFLLGFAGLSVWCQVISVSGKLGVNFPLFALFRLLNGVLNTLFSQLLFKFSGAVLPTISNGVCFRTAAAFSGPALSVSLIIMAVLLVISLFRMNQGGNFAKDLL